MSNPYFPFYALGFRSNPFRVLTDDEWVDVAVLPQAIKVALKGTWTHLQVLGDKGRGKTTTLRVLHSCWLHTGRNVAYEYLPEGQHRFLTEPQGLDILLLDEAQRLSERERRRLVRLATTQATTGLQLVLASHEDLTSLFAQYHRPLTTLHIEADSVDVLDEVLERRLGYFALPNVPRAIMDRSAVEWLWHRYGSDLRSIERALYEVFQQIKQPTVIDAALLEALMPLLPVD